MGRTEVVGLAARAVPVAGAPRLVGETAGPTGAAAVASPTVATAAASPIAATTACRAPPKHHRRRYDPVATPRTVRHRYHRTTADA